MLSKEDATKKYYELIEKCKIEDVNCEKYNYHHIEPLFTLKEKFKISSTSQIRKTENDVGELLKCSIFHHVLLHYYLCFMFDKGSKLRNDAKTSFNYTIGKHYSFEELKCMNNDELNEIAKLKESVAKTNVNDEDIKLRKNRLCLDPRFDMEEIDYFVGRYVAYGTLFAWIKWQKEQEHNPKYKNITSCNFCNQYLMLDEYGNTLQFEESMNDKFRGEYEIKLKKHQKENCRDGAKRRRKNDEIKLKEKYNRNKLRHCLCKDPRYNKIIRDKNHKPYTEYTNYYNLYNWAKIKLSSEMNDIEKEILNGFMKADEFAKQFTIKDENGEYIQIDVKTQSKNKDVEYMTDNDKSRLCYCVDPRFGYEFKITEYTNKIWTNKVCTKNSLSAWYNKHKDHEIVNGLTKKDFVNKYIIFDRNGDYVYDENEALKIVESNKRLY